MLRNITLFGSALLSFSVTAQIDNSAFTTTGRGAATTFVTDYQSIGINPANLGWSWKTDHKVAFGILEVSGSWYTDAIEKSQLNDAINGNAAKFDYKDKQQAAKDFVDKDYSINGDGTWFGIAVRFDSTIGTFGFAVQDRMQWYSTFNEKTSDLIFNGRTANYFTHLVLDTFDGDTIENTGDLDQATADRVVRGLNGDPDELKKILDGTRMSMQYYREYNLSYGRIISWNPGWQLYGGVGIKYLQGFGVMDIQGGSTLEAYSALSPDFNIDYGDAALNNPSTVTEKSGNSWNMKSVGSGFGFDIGANAIINDKIKIGLAVNDIGSITWDGNVYTAKDTLLWSMDSEGFNSLNFFDEADQVQSDEGMFTWEGVKDKKVKLPTNFRAGFGYIVNEKVEVGVDIVVPINDAPGNYEKMAWGVGGDFLATDFLRLSLGVSGGGNYGTNVPFGITFMAPSGSWEGGVAVRDMTTFFGETNPNISMAFGFLRFRVGGGA